MFEGEEFRPYAALMRELRLKREWQDGDVFIDVYLPAPHIGPSFATERVTAPQMHGRATYGEPERADSTCSFWIPRLDQWLAMLEAVGQTAIYIVAVIGGGYRVCGHTEAEGNVTGEGHTREEASARLWVAVTGWTAP